MSLRPYRVKEKSIKIKVGWYVTLVGMFKRQIYAETVEIVSTHARTFAVNAHILHIVQRLEHPAAFTVYVFFNLNYDWNGFNPVTLLKESCSRLLTLESSTVDYIEKLHTKKSACRGIILVFEFCAAVLKTFVSCKILWFDPPLPPSPTTPTVYFCCCAAI